MKRTLILLLLASLLGACTTLRPIEPTVEYWKHLPPATYGDD